MLAILSPTAPFVNPTPAEYALADRFAFEADGGNPDRYVAGWDVIEPGDDQIEADLFARSEAWWAGFDRGCVGDRSPAPAYQSAVLASEDGLGYQSGLDNFLTAARAAGECSPNHVCLSGFGVGSAPSFADEAEDLGYRLGLDGIDAELFTPDDAERSAFERGLNAGDARLWEVDPDFASHCQALAAADDQADLDPSWHPVELAEVGAGYRLMPV